VLIVGFPAAAFATNCYVAATGEGSECVVVDPGVDVADDLHQVIQRHRLTPVAVLLTHGHLDHTFSVAPVCGATGIPAYIHPDDDQLLHDPMRGLSAETRQFFGGRLTWAVPDEVRPLQDGAVIELAGLELTVDHAPGHTPGSVMFRSARGEDEPATLISGDVLFAGSIGRTDLPGGSTEQMMASLASKCLPLADDTVVLPGHGPATTIGAERLANPYLRAATELGAPSGRGL
jgi:hydroxyacylglutathione hydrolase